MTRYRHMLLAGVAALALMAGTGLASAQAQNGTPPEQQKHATPPVQGNSPGMQAQHQGGTAANRSAQNTNQGNGKGTGTQQGQGQGKPSPTAQNEKPGPQHNAPQHNAKANGRVGPSGAQQGTGPDTRHAQTINRRNKTNKGGVAAEKRTRHGRQSTAERQHTLRGLQGNASNQVKGKGPQGAQAGGANIRLSEQQRTRIQKTVIDARNAPRVGHVDFDVRVGTAIPHGRIHIVPVPATLVRIEPRWRGFLYFVYADEVVIVNPRDMRIVAVLPV